MKIVKRILVVIAIIIAIPLIAALFMKNEYRIERQIMINKPKEEVFNYIKNIKTQEHYSVWNMADPDKKTYTKGIDGTIGFIYGWNGNDQVGEGEQEITGISLTDSIAMDLRFKRPFENNAKTYMHTQAEAPGKTIVKWGMYGRSSYPMNAMNSLMDGMLGGNLKESLENLKLLLEKQTTE